MTHPGTHINLNMCKYVQQQSGCHAENNIMGRLDFYLADLIFHLLKRL